MCENIFMYIFNTFYVWWREPIYKFLSAGKVTSLEIESGMWMGARSLMFKCAERSLFLNVETEPGMWRGAHS